jgi:hypothetical protein
MARAYNWTQWVCSKHFGRGNIRKKGHRKTLTTILKASRQEHRSGQLYNNEKNSLQQIKMESYQPIKRLKKKEKKKKQLCLADWMKSHEKNIFLSSLYFRCYLEEVLYKFKKKGS